jgi:hypothetical protein
VREQLKKAIASHAKIGAFEAIILENEYLRAVIIPELGGRVWELEDRIRGRQWIWHREDVPLQKAQTGASYDDVWSGGWEELFPNDAPCRFEGRDLPDHGEWWTMSWDATVSCEGNNAAVQLAAKSTAVKTTCVKEFSLSADAATLVVNYQIRNEEDKPIHFLFKQHLAISITPECRLWMPGGRVQAVDLSFSTILPGGGPFYWPYAAGEGNSVDLRAIPPAHAGAREFVYISELPQPWCGVQDIRQGAAIRMDFDSRSFPYVWLFLTYGGWRNLYTAVLEPCTNLPKDLSEAVRLGQSARLEPGHKFETVVSVTLAGLKETGR